MRARRVQGWSLGGPVWQGEVEGAVAVVPDRTRWHSVDEARNQPSSNRCNCTNARVAPDSMGA